MGVATPWTEEQVLSIREYLEAHPPSYAVLAVSPFGIRIRTDTTLSFIREVDDVIADGTWRNPVPLQDTHVGEGEAGAV